MELTAKPRGTCCFLLCFIDLMTCNIFRQSKHCVHEEINRRLSSQRAWYHSGQNLLFSCLVCKNLKVRFYITVIMPAVVYGYLKL